MRSGSRAAYSATAAETVAVAAAGPLSATGCVVGSVGPLQASATSMARHAMTEATLVREDVEITTGRA
jgi:hypothetical protein